MFNVYLLFVGLVVFFFFAVPHLLLRCYYLLFTLRADAKALSDKPEAPKGRGRARPAGRGAPQRGAGRGRAKPVPKDGATGPAKPNPAPKPSPDSPETYALCTDGRVTVQYQLGAGLVCLVQATEALGKVALTVTTPEGEETQTLDAPGMPLPDCLTDCADV
jgi:hypothetical protein